MQEGAQERSEAKSVVDRKLESRGLPPGPTSSREIRGILSMMSDDILGAMDFMAERYGNVSAVRAGKSPVVFVRGAGAARHVLVTAQDRYVKAQAFELFQPLLGDGLVTSAGEKWRSHRKLVQPMFAKRHLVPFANHMADAASTALDGWQADWQSGQFVDVADEILHVGLDTVGRALISHDFSGVAPTFEGAMSDSLSAIGEMVRSRAVFLSQDYPRLGVVRAAKISKPLVWRQYVNDADAADSIIAEIVDARTRDGQGERDDLLRLLMETRDATTGERLSRREVIDEAKTFVMAGHETTAHGLAWMFFLLGQNHEARTRLQAEVDDVLQGRIPNAADAELLPWTRACFEEAMRLFPPVWHVPREAVHDDLLEGYLIPAGSRVLVSIWSTHRDPAVWREPSKYDPTRWLDDAHKERPRFSYLPFGGGRRACIGQGFAMLNAIILGAMISQRFEFDNVESALVEFEPTITLRARSGVPMRVKKRDLDLKLSTNGPA